MSVSSRKTSAPVAAPDLVREARRAAGDIARGEAVEIIRMCVAANVAHEAGAFIERQLTAQQVREELTRRSWQAVINQLNQGA